MPNTVLTRLQQLVTSVISSVTGSAPHKHSSKTGAHTSHKIPSALPTSSQPAKSPRKRRSSVAPADKQAKSRKAQPAAAQTPEAWPFPAHGLPPATAVKQSGKRKHKHLAALPTTVAPLHKLVKQLPVDKPQHGKQSATPAFPIRQRAKSARKAKP